jgi:hypothetical protein
MINQISTPNQANGEDNMRATYAGAKRRIAALEEQLQNLRDAGSKRKLYVSVGQIT